VAQCKDSTPQMGLERSARSCFGMKTRSKIPVLIRTQIKQETLLESTSRWSGGASMDGLMVFLVLLLSVFCSFKLNFLTPPSVLFLFSCFGCCSVVLTGAIQTFLLRNVLIRLVDCVFFHRTNLSHLFFVSLLQCLYNATKTHR